MYDAESKEAKVKRRFEKQYHTRMQNTSWHMPREARQELEDELYQEDVEESSDAFIEFLMLCFW